MNTRSLQPDTFQFNYLDTFQNIETLYAGGIIDSSRSLEPETGGQFPALCLMIDRNFAALTPDIGPH